MSEDKLDWLIEQFKEHRKETKEILSKMDDRLTKTEAQLFMYKSIINFLKTVGIVIVFLITFKFGDILKLLGKG